MISVTNRQIFKDIPFDEYRKIKGYSYSYLCNPDVNIPMTPKMRLGKLVDQYLFTPNEYSGEMQDVVRPLAVALKSMLGDALQYSTPQLTVTCDMTVQGLTMKYRGLIDLPVGKNLIVDLKVSEMPAHKSCAWFRYDRQLSGYSLAYGAANRILVSINPKTKKITTLPVQLVTDWWEFQVLQYGTPN